MIGFMPNVNVRVVSVSSTGQSSYMKQANLQGVPVYGRGRCDSKTIEVGVNLMRSAWGLRLGEEALLAVLAHGFDTLGLPVIVAGHGITHNNSQKLLERVGFKYTHNILWGSNEIEVCMWAMTAQSWRVENRPDKRGFLKQPDRSCR